MRRLLAYVAALAGALSLWSLVPVAHSHDAAAAAASSLEQPLQAQRR